MSAAHGNEALRQQMLLRALWRDARPGVVEGWLRGTSAQRRRGLVAYQANAGALAERALTAAFPTVAQLIGEESMAALARAFWAAHAPERGDVGTWGAALPAFIHADAQLAEEAYLGDVARLDWACHLAAGAEDDLEAVAGVEALAECDPASLWLRLRRGTALVESRHPIVTIRQAHRSDAEDRFAPVREAFAEERDETAIVWRSGFELRVALLRPSDIAFSAALLRGATLADAFTAADPQGFVFEAWLVAALQYGWLAEVCRRPWKES